MKKFILLFVTLFIGLSSWAGVANLTEDTEEAEESAARWFVNMPSRGTNELTLTDASITTFKVYDAGGKNGNYEEYNEGYLIVTAPDGYLLQLSGRIQTEVYWDKMSVYDGRSTDSPILLNEVSGNASKWMNISTVRTSGQSILIYFKADGSTNYEGLDLTVELFDPNKKYSITVNPANNGSVVGDKTEALVEEVVTLTATPVTGYVLSNITVKDKDNNEVPVDWVTYMNTASFIMPLNDVTVTPTFSDDPSLTSDIPYVKMPVTGTMTYSIPSDLMLLKVYDDGGKNGKPTTDNSFLVITAPEGYNIRVSGTITAAGTNTNDHLDVYDGGDKTAPKLINFAQSSGWGSKTNVPTVTSTGQTIMFGFYCSSGKNYEGLDLTLELVSTSTRYDITINNPDVGGEVTANDETAVVNQTVTLTATHDEDYVLNDLVVTDVNNNIVEVTDMKWYAGTNNATFSMPASAVTVTPTFTNDLANLYINMLQTGTKTAVIPANISSFKVYDDGGSEGDYSFSCDGTLVINAPAGCKLQLSGNIMTSQEDYLTVYDNNEASGNKLLDAAVSTDYYEWTAIPTITSTGQSMTLYFYSDNSAGITDGLDLTVTVIRETPATFAISLPESFEHGMVTCDKETAAEGEIVTLTVTPDNGYELETLVIATVDANEPSGAPLLAPRRANVDFIPGDEPNTYTFEMPAAPVTVNATFKETTITGVEDINAAQPKTGKRYNLMGQPVGKDYKGIVIEDGKKVIVK